MLDVMFEVPSRTDVASCTVTKEVVQQKIVPELVTKENGDKKSSKKKEESA
ncbi:ATP-dependent protease ATP-binding subunit ClpX [compost metagenome]